MKLYKGVIEDNKDPEKLGRVRVRVFNIHNYNKIDVPTEDLPWATISVPNIFGGLHQGIGVSSILQQGTWVKLFFEDILNNFPVIFSIIPGIHTEVDTVDIGFTDPDKVYPLEDRLKEADINRLARVEKLDKTIHKKINDAKTEINQTDTDSSSVIFNEPDSLNDKSQYTFNNVIESVSGHTIEIDDTEENERIRLYHKTGTYFEIRPDGSYIFKSVKAGDETNENYEITEGNMNQYIENSVQRYIKENLNEYIKGEVKRYIDKNLTEHIKGDTTIKIDGDLNYDVGGNVNITSGGTYTVTNGGNHKVTAPKIDLN